ncbi:hypothetical protein QE152_g31179 [Popillia japonica]|uniref:Uncharacterized protein n=1 Tax=Popillia japonica TaxID=7064 RepID=A0AAW1JC27_POPJA
MTGERTCIRELKGKLTNLSCKMTAILFLRQSTLWPRCHQDNIKMETRSTETAEFLKFFDNDFDIVNGYGVFNTHGKVLKTGVDVMYIRANYIHTEFWYNAIKHEVGFNRFKPRFLTQDSIRTLFWAD